MRLTVMVIGLFMWSVASAAGPPKSQQDYLKNGNIWFKRGQYEYAIQNYLLALKNGSKPPILYHNLGVAFYKSGRYEESKAAFRKSAGHRRYQALAYLNLALACIKTDDLNEAHKWLMQLAQTPATEAVGKAGMKLLSRVESALREQQSDQSQLFWFANSGLEDNTLPVRDEVVNTPPTREKSLNQFFDGTYFFSKKFLGSWYNNLSFNSTGYALVNSESGSDDLMFVALGVESTKEMQHRNRHFGLELSYISLDWENYLWSVDAYMRGLWRIPQGGSLELRLHWMVEMALQTKFDSSTGNKWKTRLSYLRRIGGVRSKTYLELEENQRTEELTAAGDPNFAPIRVRLRQQLNKNVGRWQSQWELEYRNSSDDVREDDRWILRNRWTRSINRNWDWGFEYEYYDQASSDDLYDFSRHRLSLQLSWQKLNLPH